MNRLLVFNSISLDGYFADDRNDVGFAYNPDPEWDAFVHANVKSEGILLFGRVTYELMAGFWPTRAAAEREPVVAERMNARRKLVMSRTLDSVSWQNTTLLHGDLSDEIRRLKESPGSDIVILGSGSLVAQLTGLGLIDEFQIVVVPKVLGGGRTMFEGLKTPVALRRLEVRPFRNGNVLIRYEPSSS